MAYIDIDKQRDNRGSVALRTTRNNMAANLLLAGIKLLAGIFAHSGAMISDAIHSLSDMAAEGIVIVGIKLSRRNPRFECAAAILLSLILFTVGSLIGWDGIRKIIGGENEVIPGAFALAAALISVAAKEAMYWYTSLAAKKTASVALRAAACHHHADALASAGSFLGILGARLGFPVLEPAACVVICALIIKVAFGVFREAIGKW